MGIALLIDIYFVYTDNLIDRLHQTEMTLVFFSASKNAIWLKHLVLTHRQTGPV